MNGKKITAVLLILAFVAGACLHIEMTGGDWYLPLVGIGIGLGIMAYCALIVWLFLSE